MVDLKDNLDEAVDEVKDELDAKYAEVQERLAKERARIEEEAKRLAEDAEGFFSRNSLYVYIAAGVIVAVGIALLFI